MKMNGWNTKQSPNAFAKTGARAPGSTLSLMLSSREPNAARCLNAQIFGSIARLLREKKWIGALAILFLSLGVTTLTGCSGFTSAGAPLPQQASPLQITTATLPSGTVNANYTANLSASGGVPPYTWNAMSGQLPNGLTLSATTGAIVGTPSQSGSFSFTAQVTDSKSSAISSLVSMSIAPAANSPLAVATASLPVGTISSNYTATLSATGGVPPYSWSIAGGQLPPGITLGSSSGTISGIPGQAGTFSFTAKVSDSKTANASASLSLNIATAGAPTITTISPNSGTTAGGTSVTISGANFQSGAAVQFGNAPATSVQVNSATQIQATTPSEAAASVNVTVTNPTGQSVTDANSFTFSAPVSSGPILPTAPAPVNLPLPFPSEAGYTVTNVTSGQLQSAINTAAQNCASDNGIVLQLPQGDVETGNFTLPVNNCPSGKWIIINTAGVTPPVGTRIDPSKYVGKIARLTAIVAMPVVATASNQPVSNYWLSGLEIEQAAVRGSNEAVDIGFNSATPAQLPNNIVIDRCYVHGKASNPVSRLVDLNGSNVAVVDSYLSEGHEVGFDAQGILSVAGGPMLIRNNFIEGAAENILFGGASNGADQPPYNDFAQDSTIDHNFIYKPVAWYRSNPAYLGIHYDVKNLYEMKAGERVLIEDNVMENVWGDAQEGGATLFQPTTPSGPNAVIDDITFIYNYIAHAETGMTLAGEDPSAHDNIHRQDRMLIQNNVFDDINASVWQGTASGEFGFFLLLGANAVTFDHNTFPFQAYPNRVVMFASNDLPETNFFFTNNINYVPAGGYGISAQGVAEGTPSIQQWYSGPPAGLFADDTLIGANCSIYPAGFRCPATASAVGFVNYNNGNGGDYRLCGANGSPAGSGCTTPSPYAAGQNLACQNNTDCGANIAQLNQNISGVAVFPANVPSVASLSPASTVCNGTNRLTINGSNLNLPGTEVLVNGVVAPQLSASATSITIAAPIALGVTVPVTVDNFGLPVTTALVCQ